MVGSRGFGNEAMITFDDGFGGFLHFPLADVRECFRTSIVLLSCF